MVLVVLVVLMVFVVREVQHRERGDHLRAHQPRDGPPGGHAQYPAPPRQVGPRCVSAPSHFLPLASRLSPMVRRTNTESRAAGTADPRPGSSTARTSPSSRPRARTSRSASPTSCRVGGTRWRWFPTVRTGEVSSWPWPRPPAPPPWSDWTSANTLSPSYSVRTTTLRLRSTF